MTPTSHAGLMKIPLGLGMDFASLACVIQVITEIQVACDFPVCSDGGGGQTGPQVHALDLA